MRKFMIVAGVTVIGGIGVVAVFWDNLVGTYDEMVAVAGEVAVESGRDLGRVSFHSVQCGNPRLMDEMQAAMEQLGSTSKMQASMRTAFYEGIEEARIKDVDYTPEFCAELQRQIEAAQQK